MRQGVARDGTAAKILVLGGGYAGVLAALRIQGKLGRAARVTLVNGAPHLVERIRLHEMVAGSPAPRHSLAALTAGSGVEVCVGWVEKLELAPRLAHVRTAEGVEALPFDTAVYALGSRGEALGVPGGDEHAHTLADEEAAGRLHAALVALPAGGEVVVVGGGLTAIEVASEVAERMPHLRVQLATRGLLGAGLSPGARDHLHSSLAALRVSVLEGTSVQQVEKDGVWLADGKRLPAKVTVWAGGFVANPLARASGLAVAPGGGMRVDACLRSHSHPFVFGAGDGVFVDAPEVAPVRMGCVTAMPQAAHAADNLVRLQRSEPLRPFGFSYFFQCISLGRGRGLVQTVRPDDAPRSLFLAGRTGAFVKERVARFTMDSLHWERRWPGSYRWPGRSTPFARTVRPSLPAGSGG